MQSDVIPLQVLNCTAGKKHTKHRTETYYAVKILKLQFLKQNLTNFKFTFYNVVLVI